LVKAKKTLLKGSIKSAPPKTGEEQIVAMFEQLEEVRHRTSLNRLKLDAYLDPKWVKFNTSPEYRLFSISRDSLTHSYSEFTIIDLDYIQPKFKGLAKLYMNELFLYGHMVFNDFRPIPSNELKKMASNLQTAKKSIRKATDKIAKYTFSKSRKKQEVKEKYKIGLALGLPNLFNQNIYAELDIIVKELTNLEAIIEADRKLKTKNTKTPLKAKLQYFIFLCKELFNMLNKPSKIKEDEVKKDIENFTINIMKILHFIKDTNSTELIKAFEWNFHKEEKKNIKPIRNFYNLMGCTNEAQFLKIKKAINF